MPRIGEQIWIGDKYCKGVYLGVGKLWPQTKQVYTLASKPVIVPDWATAVDVYCIGGGGGGTDGGLTRAGSGGGAGAWGVATWLLDGTETINVLIGTGGAGNANGADTVITLGSLTCVGNGGKAGMQMPGKDGENPGVKTAKTDDKNYYMPGGDGGTCIRGLTSNTVTPGSAPGGGGGPGFSFGDKGREGGNGGAWLIFRNCRKL